MQAGQGQEAIEHYEQALRIKPDYRRGALQSGDCLVAGWAGQEAIGHYEQALRIKPDYAEAHYNLGICFGAGGQGEEAIGHYEQALRIKPDYAEAHYNLGMPCCRPGRFRKRSGTTSRRYGSSPIMPRRTTTWESP